ncbi:MAG: MATE family efflux transporter [Bacteroidales bacterium]|nr:MATE family efflux transporter [Candidatus Egerieousia equi]
MASVIPTELGTEKVSILLRKYAVPSIVAMVASSLYNMVDSIYIGQGVGTNALAGLALTFPLMNLSAALGAMVGVGSSSVLSLLLGQKNYSMANKVFGTCMSLNVFMGIVYTVGVLLFLDPILYFFGASEQTIPHARSYMYIILLGNIITHLYFGSNAILRAAGFPKKSMTATIITIVLNTAMDPLFIFVFGWGIQGAAVATVLAQLLGFCWQSRFFSNKENVVHYQRGIYKPEWRIVKNILAIGASPFAMNSAACFVVILINRGLQQFGGDLAIGAYGIINRIGFIFVMIVMGLNQGMQPIAGYNFGAKEFGRVYQVLRLTLKYATIVTGTGFIVAEIFPQFFLRIFTSDQQLLDIATPATRIFFSAFLIISFPMVTGNLFQSIGMAGKSIFLSLSRQLIFLVPCLIVLPRIFGLNGVWMSMPISDVMAFIIAIILLVKHARKFKTQKKA